MRKKKQDNDFPIEANFGFFIIITGFLVFKYKTDAAEFWHIVLWYILPITIFVIFIKVFLFNLRKKKKQNLGLIADSIIADPDLNQIVEKFIGSFGKSKDKDAWKCREYAFDLKYINDFASKLTEMNFKISIDDNEDIKSILTKYIDKKDKNYLNQTLETKEAHNFNEFKNDGVDFENLIVRLYNAMGYESRRIGGSGDQGGDVIAARNGETILIQAKFYDGGVSNIAVQQAVAACVHYACKSAQVITTSTFTRGAIELAKTNHIQLINGQELSRLLVKFLKEVWE